MRDRGNRLPAAGLVTNDRTRRGGQAARTLLVLFVCAGIAGLGLLTGGEHRAARALRRKDPMKDYFSAAMPRYPHVREVPAGQTSGIDGTNARMSHFVSKDDPRKVADFYADFWRARGHWVRDDITHRGGVVSAVDINAGRVYQVLIDARREGQTQVFPSSNEAPRQLASNRGAGAPVALYDGSKVLINLSTRVGPQRARTVASVNDGTVEENLIHYRAALTAAGYTKDLSNEHLAGRPGGEGSPYVLVCRNKAGGEVTVNISALDKKRTRVHIMAVGE